MINKLTTVTDKGESQHCFEELRTQWAQGAVKLQGRQVGFRGGSHTGTVYWRSEEKVWGLFETPASLKRFWICWGANDPDESLNITVETNPPLKGYDRRCAGIFLCDNRGRISLGHSGRIGGGRSGIGKNAFRKYLKDNGWDFARMQWPDGRETCCLLLGQIGNDDLTAKVSAYVHAVANFKSQAVK